MSNDIVAGGTDEPARAATWTDADALAATMTRAFFDDPFVGFILQDEATRQTLTPRLFKLLFKLGLPHGACDVTPGYEAAALWRPPGAWKTPSWEYLANGSEVLDIFDFSSAGHAIRAMNAIEKLHPYEPHWYLQAIGTDPSKHGKGFGGAVMRRQLANADISGLPAYLESSKDANIPFYWPMWREARTLR